MPADPVPEPIAELIRKECPRWSSDGCICRTDLDRFRAQYVGEVLKNEKIELTVLEGTIRQTMKTMISSRKTSMLNLTGS